MANKKITDLAELTTPAAADLLEIVDDVVGTPTSKKITWANLFATPTFTGQATIPTINLTGGQIAFPAAQNPSANANTLDDYEEGTWTPDLQFGGAKVGITYDVDAGYYTKIGRRVFCSAYINLSSKGSSNGNAIVTGLPWTSINAYGSDSPVAVGYIYNLSYTGMINATVHHNGSSISLYEIHENGSLQALNDADFANTTRLKLSVSYPAA